MDGLTWLKKVLGNLLTTRFGLKETRANSASVKNKTKQSIVVGNKNQRRKIINKYKNNKRYVHISNNARLIILLTFFL